MSNLSDKIDWAVDKANAEFSGDIDEIIGLLLYVTKIYPKNRFPAWARAQLDQEIIDGLKENWDSLSTFAKSRLRSLI